MKFADAQKQDDPTNAIFLAALDLAFDSDGYTERFERLSPEARTVFLLVCFDGEVNNGGFDQLFFNSLGNHCEEILAHLKTVGADTAYGLLAKAMSWFPESRPSQDRETRWAQCEALNDDYYADLDSLNAEFFKEDLCPFIDAYVARHPDASIEA